MTTIIEDHGYPLIWFQGDAMSNKTPDTEAVLISEYARLAEAPASDTTQRPRTSIGKSLALLYPERRGMILALESEAGAPVAGLREAALSDAVLLMLDTLGEYEREWRTSNTGWTPIATAKHALRRALAASPSVNRTPEPCDCAIHAPERFR